MRFYFDISDCRPIRDEVGRDFNFSSDAVLHAKYLAADLRCLEHDDTTPTIHSGVWRGSRADP